MAHGISNSVPYDSIGGARSPAAGARTPNRVDSPYKAILARSMLGCLPEPELRSLEQWSMIRAYRARERIFMCGDAGRTVAVVLNGYVKLSLATGGGHEVILEIVPSGACIGELAVLNRAPRGTDAFTLSRCQLLIIDGRQFLQVMERCPEGLRAMVELTGRRLREATQRIFDARALSPLARMAKLLLQLAELRSPIVGGHVRIEVQVSQAELGGLMGLTRESINKHLAIMRDAGWISLSAGSISLLDVAALKELAHNDEVQTPRADRSGI